MAEEEVKQEQEQQRKVFIAFTKQLHEQINEQLQTLQDIQISWISWILGACINFFSPKISRNSIVTWIAG